MRPDMINMIYKDTQMAWQIFWNNSETGFPAQDRFNVIYLYISIENNLLLASYVIESAPNDF